MPLTSTPLDVLVRDPIKLKGGVDITNLTRADGHELLAAAAAVPVKTEVQAFRLEEASPAG